MPTAAKIKGACDSIIKTARCFAISYRRKRLLNRKKTDHLFQCYLVLFIGFALIVAGCASSFSPRAMDDVPFKTRAQTQIQGGMTEIATVPTHEEEKELYGIVAASKGMQPVCVEVKIFNGIWMNWTTMLRLPEPN